MEFNRKRDHMHHDGTDGPMEKVYVPVFIKKQINLVEELPSYKVAAQEHLQFDSPYNEWFKNGSNKPLGIINKMNENQEYVSKTQAEGV